MSTIHTDHAAAINLKLLRDGKQQSYFDHFIFTIIVDACDFIINIIYIILAKILRTGDDTQLPILKKSI